MSEENQIKSQLRLQQILILILIGVIALLGLRLDAMTAKISATTSPAPTPTPPSALPYYKEIMAVLNPLEYSGVNDLLEKNVDLAVDFNKKNWTLTNIHKFDPKGNILLDHDRYGLCGELAAHTYKNIIPFLQDRYDILFVKAAESGFFLRQHTTHIVLVLIDRTTRERFFIDPSFKRYGREGDFKDYLFFEATDIQTHLKSLTKDVLFPMDVETPLLIRKDFLLCLGVESIDGKFNKDNFALAITANRRHEYSGRYVFTLSRQNGKTETLKDEALLSQLLTPEELRKIIGKVTAWFDAAAQRGT